MKKITALFSFFILTLVVPAGFGLALARAPFPSATRLQPIPARVAPNVSGNVNSSNTSDISPVNEGNSLNIATEAQESQDNVPAQQDPKSPASSFSVNPVTILLFVSPTLLIIAGALALKKRADKDALL